MNLLDVQGLEVRYGGIRAVKGAAFAIAEGEFVCLIGANGAGKTTTLKAIAGMLPIAGGTVHYAGESIAGQPSYALARKGLALVPEGRGVFAQLTVAENLAMGAYMRRDVDVPRDIDAVYTLFPRLAERRVQTGGTLSGGEQQMLAIGRAMMSRPRLLLLDEPSMGLAPIMVEKVFAAIRSIAARGVTILLVEQNAHLALAAAHRAYVLEGGTVTLAGEARELAANPRVRAAYLGE